MNGTRRKRRPRTVRAICRRMDTGKVVGVCASCNTPVQPPMRSFQFQKDAAGSYWAMTYLCVCGDKVWMAVYGDLSQIDPARTASSPFSLPNS